MRKFFVLFLVTALLLSSTALASSAATTELSPVPLSDFMVDYTLIWQAGEGTPFEFDDSDIDFVNGFAQLNYTVLMFDDDTNITGGMTFANDLVPSDMFYVIESYSKDYEFNRTYKADGTDLLLLDTVEFAGDLLESATSDPGAVLEFYGRKYRVVISGDNSVILFGDSESSLFLMEALVGALDN